jgi:hypothetical protein
MKRILKYHIDNDPFELELPKRSTVLTIQTQNNCAVMWVLIDTEESEMVLRKFRLITTGEEFEVTHGIIFHGTFQVERDSMTLVFHVFEDMTTVV